MKTIRRSLLFIPANNPGMLQNASLFHADCVIFDLEDAVGVTEKDSARNLLHHFLKTFSLDLEVIVRINGLDTSFYQDDLDRIASDKIDTIMLPKARIKDIIELDRILGILEEKKRMIKTIFIMPIIELASSLLEIEAIVSLKRVNGILLGAEDLTSDLEIERTKLGDEITYPRSKIVYACHGAKIDAIDTPFTDVLDEDGLSKDANRAKSLGMTGKACIHPNQIAIVNEIYSPTNKQIEHALRVVEASKKNQGVFSLDGKMVDKPIIERSLKILDKAKKVGKL